MRPIRLLILLLAISLALVLALVRPAGTRDPRLENDMRRTQRGSSRGPSRGATCCSSPRHTPPDVRRPRRRLRAPLPRRPVQLGRHDAAHRLRLLGARPLRLPPLRHPPAALELGRPLARPPHLAPVPPARRPRLLLRRRPRRHLRRPRPLHRRAAHRRARSHLDDGCVLGLLRRAALPRELAS